MSLVTATNRSLATGSGQSQLSERCKSSPESDSIAGPQHFSTIGNCTDSIDSRDGDSPSPIPKAEEAQGDMARVLRTAKGAAFLQDHWFPIKESFARIGKLLRAGLLNEGMEETLQWFEEFDERTGHRYKECPSWIADELGRWMSNPVASPRSPIKHMFAALGQLKAAIRELMSREKAGTWHMPALYPNLNRRKFGQEWRALNAQVASMKEALKDIDPEVFGSGWESDPNGGERL